MAGETFDTFAPVGPVPVPATADEVEHPQGDAAMSQVEYKGWLARLGESIMGVLVGLILFIVSFPLLFWNEGRAVAEYEALLFGGKNLLEVKSDKVDPANEDKFVHISGQATTDDILKDADFGVSVKALKLARVAEIYQWDEKINTKTEKQLGGGEKTIKTPEYSQKWLSEPKNSSTFMEPAGHVNTGALTFPSTSQTAPKITVGAFTLSPQLVAFLQARSPLPGSDIDLGKASDAVKSGWKQAGEFVTTGDAAAPKIGDQRVKFLVLMPETVSIYGQQHGETFRPYTTPNKRELIRLQSGEVSGQQMIEAAQAENTMLTWILRGVGVFLMWFGVMLMFRPLVVVADVVPMFGNVLQMGVGLFAALVALPLSLITIAIGWLYYRPLLGIALLAAAAALIGLFIYLAKKKKPATT